MTPFEAHLAPIVVAGSINMDLVVRTPRLPVPGETLTGHDFAMLPGGKGANQAVACARLGASVAMIGRIGNDTFGEQLRNSLDQNCVNVADVSVDLQQPTGIATIVVADSAQNQIVLAPGANGVLGWADIDAAAWRLKQAALLILQLEVPVATVVYAVQTAIEAGCPILLNPAPAVPLPFALWRHIDYLVLNETEAEVLTERVVTDPVSAVVAARILRGKGVANVLITLGSQGVVISAPDGDRHSPALPVEAVDTTGAGDTFIGGLAVGLTEGLPLDQAAGLGLRAAAICVTRFGAQPAIPRRDELSALNPPVQIKVL